jgi:hypothetical protein
MSIITCLCYQKLTLYFLRISLPDSWETLDPLSMQRNGAAVCAVDGGIVVMGGDDANDENLATCERYTVSTGKWTPIASMCKSRYGAGACMLDGKVHVVGGCSQVGFFRCFFLLNCFFWCVPFAGAGACMLDRKMHVV